MNDKIALASARTYDRDHMAHRPSTPSALMSAAAAGPHASEPIAGVAPLARRVAAGATLFRQGDACFGIFRLLDGGIRLVRFSSDGCEVPMHTVRRGELFAEASLFARHYHCTAMALRDSRVAVYPAAELGHALQADPQALWAFTAELARHIHALRTRVEIRQTRSATQRVLQFLRLGCDTEGVFRLDGTLKQLAEELGLTHEALYRALAALADDGAIVRAAGEIRLPIGRFSVHPAR
jgi:CRP-like cAMP-binding protein